MKHIRKVSQGTHSSQRKNQFQRRAQPSQRGWDKMNQPWSNAAESRINQTSPGIVHDLLEHLCQVQASYIRKSMGNMESSQRKKLSFGWKLSPFHIIKT